MDLNYLKKLIKIVDESGVDEVEIEEEGTKIRIKKSPSIKENSPSYFPVQLPQMYQIPAQSPVVQTPQQPTIQQVNEEKKVDEVKKPEKKYHEIKSPIVGTFYRAPSPDAEPYVKVGDTVSVGQVLCIVEAMKLMNEIESDVSGRIAQILVENAKPVEFGQTLFLIEPM